MEERSDSEKAQREREAIIVATEMFRHAADYSHPLRRRRVMLPVVLFLATCASTFFSGATGWMPVEFMGSFNLAGRAIAANWQTGLVYMAAVLGILMTHEMGHFLLALRHKIPASLPYFIPVPVMPFGTMGAVIGLKGSRADRRELFDIGIAGPLAGLAVAIPVMVFGILQLPETPRPGGLLCFHNPLLLEKLIVLIRPDYPTPEVFYLRQFNPLLMAGWVGLLVTGLNTLPISQLDGGHVAYALLGRRAHILARGLVIAAILAILATEQYHWVLMLVLIIVLGADHPPTANDRVHLGWGRTILGYAAMLLPVFCFPPMGVTAQL